MIDCFVFVSVENAKLKDNKEGSQQMGELSEKLKKEQETLIQLQGEKEQLYRELTWVFSSNMAKNKVVSF